MYIAQVRPRKNTRGFEKFIGIHVFYPEKTLANTVGTCTRYLPPPIVLDVRYHATTANPGWNPRKKRAGFSFTINTTPLGGTLWKQSKFKIPFEAYLTKAFPADNSKSVSACHQKTPNLRGVFRKRRVTNTERRHVLPMASYHFTHTQVSDRLTPPLWCAVPLVLPLRAHLLGSGRADMLTGPVAAARAVIATGAWVKSKHEMYLTRGSVGA